MVGKPMVFVRFSIGNTKKSIDFVAFFIGNDRETDGVCKVFNRKNDKIN